MGEGLTVQEESNGLLKALHENWQFFAFIVTGIGAYVAGRERTRWKVHQVGDQIEALQAQIKEQAEEYRAELREVHKLTADLALSVATINAHLQHLMKGK